MQKVYTRINWINYPNTTTPLNETNLNRIDYALNEVDNRVVDFDITKANESDMLQAVKSITLNDQTGVFTITFFNGSTVTIDTLLEKLAINFDYDDDPTSPYYQYLIIELSDGTYKYIDLSALITQYEFTNTDTIAYTNTGGTIAFNVIDGSITEAKLQTNFLADCRAAKSAAEAAASSADTSEENAEAWAVGERGGVPVSSSDPTHNNNSKYYADQAGDILDTIVEHAGLTIFSVNFTTGELEYTEGEYTFNIDTTTGDLMWGVAY